MIQTLCYDIEKDKQLSINSITILDRYNSIYIYKYFILILIVENRTPHAAILLLIDESINLSRSITG